MGITDSDFAKMRDVTRGAVYHWRRNGKLKLHPDGSIDVEATNALLDAFPDVYKGGRKDRGKLGRPPRQKPAKTAKPAGDKAAIKRQAQTAPIDEIPELQESIRRKEHYLAELRRLELAKAAGEMVPVEDVIAEWTDRTARFRSRMLAIPSKLAPVLLANDTAIQNQTMMYDEICHALQELSEDEIVAKDEDDEN